jgi:NTP pyrophosphatase (non-canonical NTP hydrolase)
MLLDLNEVADEALRIKHEKWFAVVTPDDIETNPERIIAQIALIHSEASEMLEAYNKERNLDHFQEEGIDVIIRTLELLRGVGTDIPAVLMAKMAKNQDRPPRHGNKRIN